MKAVALYFMAKKMNDLTKEELESIHNCINLHYGGLGHHRYNQLLKKIQFMIDNYCDHPVKEHWKEFLDWYEDNKDNLPEWASYEISMHELMLLWKQHLYLS